MHQSTITAFFKFTELEGRAYSMYLDGKGLVMTGAGNLIDPAPAALALPWRLPDGSFASKIEIGRQWQMLKARQDLAKLHYTDAAKLTTIRLTEEDVDTLVVMKLLANEDKLRAALPGWDGFPADAQLACCSMFWAIGPAFTSDFPSLTQAANEQDWNAAKLSCKIRADRNPDIARLNAAHERCFANAAFVLENTLPIDVLYWPERAASSTRVGDHARAEAALRRASVLVEQIDEAAVSRRDFLRELSGLESQRPGTDEPDEGAD